MTGRDVSSDQLRAAQIAWSETPMLQDICEVNGISRDDFLYNRHQVEGMELFLMALPVMKHVAWFPGLVKLQIVHQSISVIEGLDELVSLEYCWLNENNISKIQGLESCTRLKELYLYSNNISEIEGLDCLTGLEVLWLQDNKISELGGLTKLTNLRVLWVAANQLVSMGHHLDANLALEELNIAGNQIGSFREIPHLDRLPNLTHVYFSDPHFGDNPVCQLCNYQTYTLYHLSRVRVIDYNIISDESRQLAEATFVKKKMYYNMRIKTLKRNTNNLIKKADQFRQTKHSEVNLALNVLCRMAKELERELEEAKRLPDMETGSSASISEYEVKLQSVKKTTLQKHREIELIDEKYEQLRETIETIIKDNISRLLVELQTGGNIRMEEGKPQDVWYQSCMDLVRGRFCASDFAPFGISGIRITKVARVHSRFPKNRFEDRLDHLIDTSNQNYKKALEYLFYGEDPELPGELSSSIESGFRNPAELEANGKEGGIPLTNSVFLSEQNRLIDLHKKGLLGPNSNFKNDGLMGRLLVTKVYLGKCCQARSDPAWKSEIDSKEQGFEQLIASKGSLPAARIRRKDYSSSLGSVFRCKSDNEQHRVWFCFDNLCIMPEYLVEFMYIPTADPQSKLPISTLVDYSTDDRLDELQEVINKLVPTKSELDATDIRSYSHYFLSYIHQCNFIAGSDKETSCELVSSAPVPAQRPKASEIDLELIKRVTRCTELDQVIYLNLFGNHIRSVELVHLCVNMRHLILSFNEIQKIEGIQDLPHLTHLDLSFNLIKKVDGLKGLPSLSKLELNNNLIYRLEDVNVIKKIVPTVVDLSLQNNAICEVRGYRYIVLRRVPGLKLLDGKPVTADDLRSAQDRISALSHSLIAKHCHTQPTLGWALCLQPLSNEGGKHWKELSRDGEKSSVTDDGDDKIVSVSDELALTKAVEINCSKLKVRRIQSFEKCRDVRKLNLSENEISKIENLENNPNLEELYLDDNKIIKIENLTFLTNIRKLELGKNKINKIEGLEALPHLSQLSLEDNDIYSLQGIHKVQGLMELYIGNNKIDNLKELNYLREVPKLIILDLSGNPLCNENEYRLYTVFNLKKLKVLDGVSIDTNETTKAKETFAGKMSPELLTEKVGKMTEWVNVTELNLSSCSIRELSLLEHFPSLLHLKCDHNLLNDVNGLRECTTLLSLNLNSNRLTSDSSGKTFPIGKCLEQMSSLESLSLEGNQISSLSGLCLKLPNLKFLNLRSNEITRIDGLEHLAQLCELIVDRNKLRGFDERSFMGCHCLRDLRAEENMIKHLDGLRFLPNLNRLFLTANRVSDLNEIDKLEGFDRLTEIYLSGNAVVRKSMYRPTLINKLPNCLVIDGNEITTDERDKAELIFNQEYYAYQHPPNVFTDRQAVLGAGQTASSQPPQKGTVKLVSFEYHDSVSPAPVYHCQPESAKVQGTTYSSRARPQGQPLVRANTMRTNSADGSGRDGFHNGSTGAWPSTAGTRSTLGQVRNSQAKLGRQRTSTLHSSYSSSFAK